jgi:Protein of unknown function (DUF2490)
MLGTKRRPLHYGWIAWGFCLCSLTAGAQFESEGLGSWNIVNARLQLNKKWSAWGELQLRSLRFYNHFHYHETKGGFQYNLGQASSVLVGFGRYVTYSPGGNFKSPIKNDELRTWLQFSMGNRFGRLRIEHRYRIEQRWTSVGYRNRFRYRLNLIMPINKPTIEAGTWYATGWNEIFLTNLQPHFERNRAFLGIGYEVTDPFTIQAGFLNQYDYRLAVAPLTKNFFQLSLLFDLKSYKTGRERHPSTFD